MINQSRLIYILGVAAIPVIARLWVRLRQDRRVRRESTLPLFDSVVLEIALTPKDGEDIDVLVEIRETLKHLNRRQYAEEFWMLDEQLAQYYEQIPQSSRPTMEHAILRLLDQPDRWLQAIAAKTSARLCLLEAKRPIDELLQSSGDQEKADNAAEGRFREQMAAARDALAACPGAKSGLVSSSQHD